MGSRRVNLHLDVGEIEALRKNLMSYSRKLRGRGNRICRAVAEVGLSVASKEFMNAQYDGENDVFTSIASTEKGVGLFADGNAVAFIEFGTGVHYNGMNGAYPLPKPAGVVGIGEYGEHYGVLNTWAYEGSPGTNARATSTPGVYLTHGNPANLCMYHADEEMRRQANGIVKGVMSDVRL